MRGEREEYFLSVKSAHLINTNFLRGLIFDVKFIE
jgi:hypothetical protein